MVIKKTSWHWTYQAFSPTQKYCTAGTIKSQHGTVISPDLVEAFNALLGDFEVAALITDLQLQLRGGGLPLFENKKKSNILNLL